jgi:hypothetical protein
MFPVSFGALDGDKGGVVGKDCLGAGSMAFKLVGKFESFGKLRRWMDKPHDR